MAEDSKEKLRQVLEHPVVVPGVVGVAAFAVGLGVGYILGRRSVEPEVIVKVKRVEPPETVLENYEELTEPYISSEEESEKRFEVDPEVEPIPEEVDRLYKETAAKFVEDRLKRTIEQRQATSEVPEAVDESVFATGGDDDGWDYEEELKTRSESSPYVLHKDEFYAEEKNYQQLTLTYFEGDDILVDEEEVPIYNHVQVIGPRKFGHGSGDPNVFYVRNDKRRTEYEILRDPGLYSVEVLGLDIEDNVRVRNRPRDRERDLKHSGYGKFKLE